MTKKISSIALAALLVLLLAACGAQPAAGPGTDRAGNAITPPAKAEKIVSLAASTTRILYDLGLGDKLVAIDSYSAPNLPEELAAALPQLDMMAPDLELLTTLSPDIIFTSNLSSAGGPDAFSTLRQAGVCIAEIPTPVTVDGIFEDVQFIADCTGTSAEGKKLVEDAQASLAEAAALLVSVSERPSVYFEVSPAPNCYSTGSGTYLDELIALAGGINIFSTQQDWIAVTEESIVTAAPEVIFTVVDFMPDPISEIGARPGWQDVPAVANGRVVQLNALDSQQPTQHVVDAVWQMLAALHPGLAADAAA